MNIPRPLDRTKNAFVRPVKVAERKRKIDLEEEEKKKEEKLYFIGSIDDETVTKYLNT